MIKEKLKYFEDNSLNYDLVPVNFRTHNFLENYNRYIKLKLGEKRIINWINFLHFIKEERERSLNKLINYGNYDIYYTNIENLENESKAKEIKINKINFIKNGSKSKNDNDKNIKSNNDFDNEKLNINDYIIMYLG